MDTIIDVDDCPICMDRGEHPLITLPCCHHGICEKCYQDLPKRECPFCRQPIEPVEKKTSRNVSFPLQNIMCMHSCGCCVCLIFGILFLFGSLFGFKIFYLS